jgi:hypothetical protein
MMAEVRLKNFDEELYKRIKDYANEKGIKLIPLLEKLLIDAIKKHLNIDQLKDFKDLLNYDSKYGIKISQRKDGAYVVVITELTSDRRFSTKYSYEKIANQIRTDYEILPNELIFIEQYPEKGRKNSSFYREETYDLISFTWNGREYKNPRRKHLPKKEFRKIINS